MNLGAALLTCDIFFGYTEYISDVEVSVEDMCRVPYCLCYLLPFTKIVRILSKAGNQYSERSVWFHRNDAVGASDMMSVV